MKERQFMVIYERRGRRSEIAASATSAIRAMESVLRAKHGFTDHDNVRDFCARLGCRVSVR